MLTLMLILLGIIVIFAITTRILILWALKKCEKKFGIVIRSGRLGWFCINNVIICKANKWFIEISSIRLSSSILSNKSSKLINIIVKSINVKIEEPSKEGGINVREKQIIPNSEKDKQTTIPNAFGQFINNTCVTIESLDVTAESKVMNVHCQASAFLSVGRKKESSGFSSYTIDVGVPDLNLTFERNGAVLVKISSALQLTGVSGVGPIISSLDIKTDFERLEINIMEDLVTAMKQLNNARPTREQTENNTVDDTENGSKINKTLASSPKTVAVTLKCCKMQYMTRDEKILCLEWNSSLSWQHKTEESISNSHSYEMRVELVDVVLNDNQTKTMLNLKQISLVNQLITSSEKYSWFTAVSLDGLHINCLPDNITSWLKHITKHVEHQPRQTIAAPASQENQNKTPMQNLKRLPANMKVSLSFAIRHCCIDLLKNREDGKRRSIALFYLGEIDTSIHRHPIGEDVSSSISFQMSTRDLYVYFNKKHLDVSYPSCKLPFNDTNDNPSVLPLSEKHIWGRVVELGKFTFKVTTDDTTESKLQLNCNADIHFLTFELSAASSLFIVDFLFAHVITLRPSHETNVETQTQPAHPPWFDIDAEIHTSKFSIIVIGDKEDGYNSIISTIDTVDVTTGSCKGPVMLELKSTQLSRFLSPWQRGPLSIYQTSMVCAPFMSISTLSVYLLNSTSKHLTVGIPEVSVEWDATKQMIVYELIESLKSVKDHMTDLLPKSVSSIKIEKSKSNQPLTIEVDVTMVAVAMSTGNDHSFSFVLNKIGLNCVTERVAIKVSDGHVAFDKQTIFCFEELELKQLSNDALQEERSSAPKLCPSNPRAWGVSLYTLGVNFPHKFNFALSLDEVQNFTKMFKALHVKRDGNSKKESVVPPDIIFHCQNFKMEIEDNPFEIDLAENYMLRLDELDECIERETKLLEKLNSLQSTQGTVFSSKKMDGIFNSLKEKNSQIFIARSKAYKEKKAVKPPLFRYFVSNINCCLLADPSYCGQANAISLMEELDPDSAIPDDVVFSTLICRYVNASFQRMKVSMRDYPQALMSQENYSAKGCVLLAEPVGSNIAIREAFVNLEKPWDNFKVKRNMPALKIYYDLSVGSDYLQTVWGVNLESTWSSVSQAFDLFTKPTMDPSQPLPFWDKCRILFHGNFCSHQKELNMILNASRDPYDITEKLEIVWKSMDFTWTNAKICMVGDFDLFTRTASKYDDHRVAHIPSFRLCFDLEWACSGDPNDHYGVEPRNPSLLSDIELKMDTYKEFRSHNLNMVIEMDACHNLPSETCENDPPLLLLYATSLRWFQKYQAIVLRNVSRPITSGKLFNKIVKPRKKAFSRHIKFLSLNLRFPCLQANYYGSFTREAGFEMKFGAGSMGIQYQVHIDTQPVDNLRRRPVAEWIIRDLKFKAEKTLTSLIETRQYGDNDKTEETEEAEDSPNEEIVKKFLFSVEKVGYKRQTPTVDMSRFTHCVSLHQFHGAVTSANRDTALELFKAYTKMQTLKRVLSSDVFKFVVKEKDTKVTKSGSKNVEASPSPLAKMQSGQGVRLLQQLVSEQASKFMAKAEESENSEQDMSEYQTTEESDIIRHDWHIELLNSQVFLKAIENTGAILVTAANATILKRLHLPINAVSDVINKLNKVTWSAALESLQYFYAPDEVTRLTESTIPWLGISLVRAPADVTVDENEASSSDSTVEDDTTVGFTVDVEVDDQIYHLQRVISRCVCQVNYISFDTELDPLAEELSSTVTVDASPISGSSIGANSRTDDVNTLIIRHPLLDITTTPEQFAAVMDICENLILYTEPKRKEAQNRLARLKFKLELTTGREDLKGDIQQMQVDVRNTLVKLRQLERNLYDCRRAADVLSKAEQECDVDEMRESIENLQELIEVTKNRLYGDAEDLKVMIRAFKDVVQRVNLTPSSEDKSVQNKGRITKNIKVYFDEMKWLLTKEDGCSGIAGAGFKKFLYNKLTFTDNSCEHRVELGDFALCNLLPDEIYRNALSPHEINLRRRVDKSVYLRIFCRIKPPVGGINIREHFEVNVCPIAVRLTFKFYQHLEAFFFPHKNANESNQLTDSAEQGALSGVNEDDGKTKKLSSGQSSEKKVPPPRPPPPRRKVSSPSLRRAASSASRPTVTDTASSDMISTVDGKRKKSAFPAQHTDLPSPPQTPLLGVNKGSGVRRARSMPKQESTDDRIDKMNERAAKNQTFIYIKIPEVPLYFSYKGEKERNIEDASDFSLCLPTLEYHNRTWTWEDLLLAMKKDYTQVLVPQIIKEKLHLKGGWDVKAGGIADADDNDKAKLLFGEKQFTSNKKHQRKLLFGKLTNLLPGGKPSQKDNGNSSKADGTNSTATAEMSGRGIDPVSLGETFNKLRTFSKDNKTN